MKLELPGEWKEITERVGRVPHFKNVIDGQWDFFTEKRREVLNPVNGDTLARVPDLDDPQIEMAIDAAWRNREHIRDVPAVDRVGLFDRAGELLQEHAEMFARTLVLETGKPILHARDEVRATAVRMRLAAREAHRIFGEYLPGDWCEATLQQFAIVTREPLGVVLAISPFSYPLLITASKVTPALLAGNSVVVKLPSAAPLTFLIFTRLLELAGFPPGCLSVITAPGAAIGRHVAHPKIDAVSFSGSAAVGRQLAHRAGVARLHLELGGNGSAVVTARADLGLAARKSVLSALSCAGQRSGAVSRIFAVEEIADDLVRRVLEEVRSTPYGDPTRPETVVGPLIDGEAVRRVAGLVRDAAERGAEPLLGGGHQDNLFEPTVLDRVPLEARLMQEETFGPVVAIHRTADLEGALEAANWAEQGPDTCVFTHDFYEAWTAAHTLQAGAVTVNDHPSHGGGCFPYAGGAAGGIGRQGVGYSIEEMTRLKTVVFNLGPAGLGAQRHPRPL